MSSVKCVVVLVDRSIGRCRGRWPVGGSARIRVGRTTPHEKHSGRRSDVPRECIQIPAPRADTAPAFPRGFRRSPSTGHGRRRHPETRIRTVPPPDKVRHSHTQLRILHRTANRESVVPGLRGSHRRVSPETIAGALREETNDDSVRSTGHHPRGMAHRAARVTRTGEGADPPPRSGERHPARATDGSKLPRTTSSTAPTAGPDSQTCSTAAVNS